MRLYLSSFRFGNHPEELVRLAARGAHAAVVMNARDAWPDNRAIRCKEEIAKLNELGFVAEELDLREYFGRAEALGKELQQYGLVWVSGGNVFMLRMAMKKSGFDNLLIELLRADKLVYAGYSAAGCVLAPSLEAYKIVDDPKLVNESYGGPADFSGLQILNYYFEPHYKSDHPESPLVDKEVEELKAKGLPYKTLHDGEVIIVDAKGEQLAV
jgi:dipeptidase E